MQNLLNVGHWLNACADEQPAAAAASSCNHIPLGNHYAMALQMDIQEHEHVLVNGLK